MTLTPYPFGALLRRAFRELETRHTLFGLPTRKVFRGDPAHDLSVRVHGRRASTPFGPAAGPHTQLAHNIALSWLVGGRIIELKTVQARDELTIPRPCIDMQTVGYNVEWSQELRLDQSLEEYVKAAMLVRALAGSETLGLPGDVRDVTFDVSVGYDHEGLTGARVRGFLDGVRDATPAVDRLRREIPAELGRLRDLDFPSTIASSATLSTFHGCPPGEIARMAEWLMRDRGLDCVVKLNPTLLGYEETCRVLDDRLGYHDIRCRPETFARDTTWAQMTEIVERLTAAAAAAGVRFGVKLTNTLVVENHRHFFPTSEREMYLSGAPLHVLAVELVRRMRKRFGEALPISFSAGIDRQNFADGVALGLVPVTACSDLLQPGGYGRASAYFRELGHRMDAVGAGDLDAFVLHAYGHAGPALDSLQLPADTRQRAEQALARGGALRAAVGDELFDRWRAAAVLVNTATYADRVAGDRRYAREHHARPPRKIGRTLRLFDCLSCDKCLPVCPNDANFTFVVPPADIPVVKLRREGSGWARREDGRLVVDEPHQIGNFADFCNDCGNCDVFCPEDGGPYNLKPRCFGSEEAWRRDAGRDGFFARASAGRELVLGRLGGRELRLEIENGGARFSGPGFAVAFREDDPESTLEGDAAPGAEVDLGAYQVMRWLVRALYAPGTVNYVNCL